MIPKKGATYGKLYNWYAVMGITTLRDATPTEEQIGLKTTWLARSSDEEWTTLPLFRRNRQSWRQMRKWEAHWKTPNADTTSSSGLQLFREG
jgi:hypothetical protein